MKRILTRRRRKFPASDASEGKQEWRDRLRRLAGLSCEDVPIAQGSQVSHLSALDAKRGDLVMAPSMEKPSQRIMPMSLRQLGKPLLIFVVILFILITVMHGAKDVARIPPPKMGWLALAFILFLVHYFIQAMGWHFILRALGQQAPLRVSLRMYYLSLLARWMPGRIWYTATRLLLAREAGLSMTAVSFGIVLELIYVLVAGILASLIFANGLFSGLLATPGVRSALGVMVGVIVLAGTAVLRPQALLWLCRFPFFRKAVRRVAGEELTDQNMPRLGTVQSLILLGYYTFFWIYSGVMFGTLAGAFLPMRPALWQACIPAFAGSWLVGFFSIVTPAGLGAREGAMWLMLRGVMFPAQAAVLALASRLMMLGTELVCAGLAAVLLRTRSSPPETAQFVPSPGEAFAGRDLSTPSKVSILAGIVTDRRDGM